jgi:hypothetical protein
VGFIYLDFNQENIEAIREEFQKSQVKTIEIVTFEAFLRL